MPDMETSHLLFSEDKGGWCLLMPSGALVLAVSSRTCGVRPREGTADQETGLAALIVRLHVLDDVPATARSEEAKLIRDSLDGALALLSPERARQLTTVVDRVKLRHDSIVGGG